MALQQPTGRPRFGRGQRGQCSVQAGQRLHRIAGTSNLVPGQTRAALDPFEKMQPASVPAAESYATVHSWPDAGKGRQ
jgi:hypothetical protein